MRDRVKDQQTVAQGSKTYMKTGRISDVIYKRSVTDRLQRQRAGMPLSVGQTEIRLFSGCFCGHYRDAGVRAVIYASNKAFAAGMKPQAMSLQLTVSERVSEKKVSDIVADAERFCMDVCNILLDNVSVFVDGDIENPCGVVANAVCAAKDCGDHRPEYAPESGAEIVLTGWIAMDEASDIAFRHREELLTRLPAGMVDRVSGGVSDLSVAKTSREIAEYSANTGTSVFMHPVAEEGILCALRDMGERIGLGLRADGRSIQMLQEIVEVCEFFDIDPYRMASSGCLLTAVKDGEALAEYLLERGTRACVIGEFTADNDRVILMDEEYRYLEPYRGGRITV